MSTSDAPLAADEQGPACWLCLDEGEITRMDLDEEELVDCPVCLRAEGIALRAECATKTLENEQLRLDLAQQTANATAVLQMKYERDCAVEDVFRLQQQNERLEKKCAAMAFLLYGSPVCTRSHPHENMNEECARLTQAARDANPRAHDVPAEPEFKCKWPGCSCGINKCKAYGL